MELHRTLILLKHPDRVADLYVATVRIGVVQAVILAAEWGLSGESLVALV